MLQRYHRKTLALLGPLLPLLLVLMLPEPAWARNTVDLTLRDVELSAAMEMLSRREKVNIVVGDGVEGVVSLNLYGVEVVEAIHMIANAAGYSVERRGKSYHVIEHDQVNNYSSSDQLQIRTFRLRYSEASTVGDMLKEYLSAYGTMTLLEKRNMIVIEDTPDFLRRIARLVEQLDYRPKQVLIEAKILEVRLDDTESFGVEWSKLFNSDTGTNGSFGTQSLADANSPGFFVNLNDSNFTAVLDALENTGKARTLSSPTLLTVEHEPASVIIGNRLGYLNTVTINQVTTETTEFLESGVILEVTPSVDGDDNIHLEIHPEVSTGTVTDGIPSQDTTAVDTQLIVPNGATSFIGGLMRLQKFNDHRGVPLLGRIPVAGKLFSRTEDRAIRTEIIVLITPRIVDPGNDPLMDRQRERVEEVQTSISDTASVE